MKCLRCGFDDLGTGDSAHSCNLNAIIREWNELSYAKHPPVSAVEYKYPSAEEVRTDIVMETAAIATAVSAMADALDACPLKDHFKVYAAIELAFKYGDKAYVEEVFSEVALLIKSRG